jgi:hypothetical protein
LGGMASPGVHCKQATHSGATTGRSSSLMHTQTAHIQSPVGLGMLTPGDAVGNAVGWADAQTHDWLQQQQLLQGQQQGRALCKASHAAPQTVC